MAGNPAAFFISLTIEGVPTNTLVPESTIAESKLKLFPAIETASTLRTHQAYNLTG